MNFSYKALVVFLFFCFNLLTIKAQVNLDTSGTNIILIAAKSIDIENRFNFTNHDYNLLYLDQVYFDSAVNIKENDFSNLFKITNVEFNDDADFENNKFENKVILNEITFHKTVNFDNTSFGEYASFSNLNFEDKGELTFNRATLPDTLIFDYNTKIPNVDFTETELNDTDKHYISLFKSDISKVHLDYIHFKLKFVNYAGVNLTNEEKGTVYEALLDNFKTHGQTESYERLDTEYQSFKWTKDSWSKWFVWLPKWWWNFGYDKELIFSRTALFVFIFTFITYFFIHYLNTNVYNIQNIPKNKWQKKLAVDDFFNRLWFAFVYTTTVFFRLTLKVEQMHFEKKLGTAYLILIYTLGLICLAYMANFVLQK